MTYILGKMDENKPSADSFNFSFGRGRLIGGLPVTPVRDSNGTGSPAFCSTRIVGQAASSPKQNATFPDNSATADPGLDNLITQIAQQVGLTIRDHLKGGFGESDGRATQSHPGAGQLPHDSTYLNLTGAKLVLQSDVREPPIFRGEGSDKTTICEWEEIMKLYLRKRAIPMEEQHSEIMSRLMGKAKDIVRITLRSSPSLKAQENPEVIYQILRQHFSEVSYSCMPMADFYSTVPVTGESPLDYWVRLNKAVDAAEEGLKRLGRHLEDPCQEAVMMFVKHCPDPALAAVFKFKAPDKWTASEIQEHIDRYHIESKEQVLSRLRPSRPITVYAQAPALENHPVTSQSAVPTAQVETSAAAGPSCNDGCMKTLMSLFERALSQNNQATSKPISPGRTHFTACRVCQSPEHSTVAHCRQKRLCLACFQPNHIKRDCPNRLSAQDQHTSQPQNSQHLN